MMSWRKQALSLALIAAAVSLLWLRVDPGAAAKLRDMGVSPLLISLMAKAPQTTGNDRAAAPGRGSNFGAQSDAAPVITAVVGNASINDRVSAIGDGEALRSVIIVPLSAGMLTEVIVKPGDRVAAGQVLARLDAEAEEIARDQAELSTRITSEKVQRYERLVQSRTVSEVQLAEARNELDNARLVQRKAEFELERRSIIAPIDGTVGLVPVESGDYVTQQTEIAIVDDRGGILLDFWVPERFAPRISVGQPVNADAIALSGTSFPGIVYEVASRIDRDSRTLQVRARIDNKDDLLRPGMSFRVNLRFPGDSHPAVDPLSVQWSSDGPYVWKVNDGKAERVAIRIIQRNSDFVLVAGALVAGDEVVTEGLQSLRPGAALNVTRRTGAAAQTDS